MAYREEFHLARCVSRSEQKYSYFPKELAFQALGFGYPDGSASPKTAERVSISALSPWLY